MIVIIKKEPEIWDKGDPVKQKGIVTRYSISEKGTLVFTDLSPFSLRGLKG